MAKDSDRLADSFRIEESGGALSRLLADEEEFDRHSLWRLGSWAAISVGSVIIAILASQYSIGMRRDLTASADLVRQAQQIQLAAKDNLTETRRLASAVETLNGDRDRLYSRVAVLEQGLDSVTGTIARQNSSSSPAQPNAPPSPAAPAIAAPSAASAVAPSPAPVAVAAPAAPAAASAAVDAQPAAAKPATASASPAPTPVAATVAVATEKPASKAPSPDPGPAQAAVPAPAQPAPAQAVASLIAPKSMMAPPDPGAAKLIEPAPPPKAVTSAPMPEVTAAVSNTSEHEDVSEAPPAAPELAVRRTEFGVDVGGANSIPGLRALWRGLLKSKANAALTTLRPIIVIKENSNGLGMQLRLVAGPISDAAAAAKICATLTVSDRSCTTAVFEGQRLAVDPEEQTKADAKPETAPAPVETKPAPKPSLHRRYSYGHAPKEEPKPEQQPSTLSLIFGRR